MNLKFYEFDVLEAELTGLPPFHRLAFAAACCERLLPNYNAFAAEEGWGDEPAILRAALDEIWQILHGKSVDADRIHQLLEACEGAYPNSDNVSLSRYEYVAQEADSGIRFTLEACLDPTPQNVVKVAEKVTETIYGFLNRNKYFNYPSWWDITPLKQQKEKIASHRFAVREMAKQSEDLQRLKNIEKLDWNFLEWLRTSFDNDGRSLIDL